MSKFCPGQRVVCINGEFAPDVWEWTDKVPLEGEFYTVGAVVYCPHRLTGKHGGSLHLVEIDTSMPAWNRAPRLSWDIARFAPLDISETSTASRKKNGRPKKKEEATPRRRTESASA